MADKEYIEREAVRNELLKISICTDDLYGMGILEGLDRATRRVNNAPAADVAPVVHGEWFLLDECSNEGVYCSVCTKKVYRTEYANQKLKSNYCPNCGAKMDGGRNEQA